MFEIFFFCTKNKVLHQLEKSLVENILGFFDLTFLHTYLVDRKLSIQAFSIIKERISLISLSLFLIYFRP